MSGLKFASDVERSLYSEGKVFAKHLTQKELKKLVEEIMYYYRLEENVEIGRENLHRAIRLTLKTSRSEAQQLMALSTSELTRVLRENKISPDARREILRPKKELDKLRSEKGDVEFAIRKTIMDLIRERVDARFQGMQYTMPIFSVDDEAFRTIISSILVYYVKHTVPKVKKREEGIKGESAEGLVRMEREGRDLPIQENTYRLLMKAGREHFDKIMDRVPKKLMGEKLGDTIYDNIARYVNYGFAYVDDIGKEASFFIRKQDADKVAELLKKVETIKKEKFVKSV